MDWDRTSTGNQGRGTNEGNGYCDLEERAKNSIEQARARLTVGLLSLGFGLSLALGAWTSYVSTLAALFIGAFMGCGIMVVGMAIAVIKGQKDAACLREALSIQKEAMEIRADMRVKQSINEERKECGLMAVEMSRAVANRVANRIIARYATDLTVGARRKEIFKEADQVVEEEMAAFQAAVQNESEAVEKS